MKKTKPSTMKNGDRGVKRRWITLIRIIHAGAVNFIRGISLAVAAMAVMVITLTIVLFSVITNATLTHTINGIADKIDVSVYLQDSVTQSQTQNLVTQLKTQPDVRQIVYYNKQQALQRYINLNAGNQALANAATVTNNPIPATIVIKPKDLNRIPDIKNFLEQKQYAALQTTGSPSYSGSQKEAIDNISHATDTLREIGVIAIIVFALVSVLIIFNTIQIAIFNRRDEIQIERLLGASTGYIRGPFVVESIIYGLLSALLSVLLIYGAFKASSNALQASSLGLLDIGYAAHYFYAHFILLLTIQLVVGIVIGAASSTIATRRYLRFKTR